MKYKIRRILESRVTTAFNDCGNSYDVIDADIDELNKISDELCLFTRNEILEHLQAYTQYLLDNGYTDTDVIFEEEPAVDRYIAQSSLKSIKLK
jgi:hypothetical protein